MRCLEQPNAWPARMEDWNEQELATDAKLAAIARIDRTTVYRWRRGKGRPTPAAIKAWRNASILPREVRCQCQQILAAENAGEVDIGELDVNQDKLVDFNDILDLEIEQERLSAQKLGHVRDVQAGRRCRDQGLATIERIQAREQLAGRKQAAILVHLSTAAPSHGADSFLPGRTSGLSRTSASRLSSRGGRS